MKLDALDHPKTLDFAARLDVPRPTAIGHLELLWAFTGKQSAQGNVGKWPDGAIARACDWMGPPEAFINALVGSGFVDRDPSYRLTVHDWSDHAPGWVRAKLKKLGLDFLSSESTSEPTSERSSDDDDDDPEQSLEATDDTSEASLEPSILAKRSEAKRSEARKGRVAPFDPTTIRGLDLPSWERWLVYRAERKPAIKPASMQAAAEELARFGDQQATVVRHSIAQGYQGLFPPRDQPRNGSAKNSRAPAPDNFESIDYGTGGLL